MKLPKTLYVGYNLLKRSRVSVKKENDEDALLYFQNILNDAQPKTPEDFILHRFVNGMYNENKHRFLSFIKNTNFECLVLWTESRSIVNYLGLRGVVYTKWTGKETMYSVTKFQSTNRDENVADPTSYKHPLMRRQRKQYETKNQKTKDTSVTVLKKKDLEDPKGSKVPEETGDSTGYYELLAPDVLSLTRMSSVAMGTDGVSTKWGDMESDE